MSPRYIGHESVETLSPCMPLSFETPYTIAVVGESQSRLRLNHDSIVIFDLIQNTREMIWFFAKPQKI